MGDRATGHLQRAPWALLLTAHLLKVSPPPSARVVFDSQIEDILAVGRAYGVRGYIATNTAADRDDLRTR